jgi:hypothetical protein
VGTSRIARKGGLASRLTAEAVAADVVEDGAVVATLGIFEQGFYNRLGFGTVCDIPWVSFDPAHLNVKRDFATPVRLDADDWERIHSCRLERLRRHGACSILSADVTRAELMLGNHPFGLGFTDGEGRLTHHLWCRADGVAAGPYIVHWMAYRDREGFLDLMALLRSLGEQVRLVRMPEPPSVQIQDLLTRPFRRMSISEKSPFEAKFSSFSYVQTRICDLAACLEKTRFKTTDSVTFNMSLADPIEGLLDPETKKRWCGTAGHWVVTLGPESHAERASPDPGLPTLRTSVNTFSRMWLGVRPPSGLAMTSTDLDAPEELIERLDDVLRLPPPQPDWEY